MTRRILLIGEGGCSEIIRAYVGTDADICLASTLTKALDTYSQDAFDKVIADFEYIAKFKSELLALLSAAVNSAPGAAIAHLDTEFNFIWINSAYEMLLGPSLKDIKGSNYFDLHNADDKVIFDFVKKAEAPFRISLPLANNKYDINCTVSGLRSPTQHFSGYAISITHVERCNSTTAKPTTSQIQPISRDNERKRLKATIEQLKQEVEERRKDINELVAFEDQRREVYEREHRIAEILQQALIPPQLSYNIDDCRIVVKYQPALDEAAVGGDFYDIFELDDDKIGIVIGDVAGKGLPAAMRVAAARYSMRSYAFLDPSPSVVMTLANQALCREQTEEAGLLTAFYAVLDLKTAVLTFANGGHEPPLVLAANGDVKEINLQGGGLGFYEGFIYAEDKLDLSDGEVVVMITDGITEARSAKGKFFENTGVKRYLSENSRVDIESLAQGLVEAARNHACGYLQDDAAVVVLQLKSRSNQSQK